MRLDKPTLMCDRCKTQTQDLGEMSRFSHLYRNTISNDTWDLCPTCWKKFVAFVNEEE